MFSAWHKSINVENLKDKQPKAQIATLLILIMVAVLIFILITVNLGQLSLSTTGLSNAVDSASLGLASQVASKANYLKTTLQEAEKSGGGVYSSGPPPQVCFKQGALGMVLAILGGLIGLLFGFPNFLIMSPILASIGGAIGGAIVKGDVKGALQGALDGLISGAITAGAAFVGQLVGTLITAAAKAAQLAQATAQVAEKTVEVGEKFVEVTETATEIGEKATEIGETATEIGETATEIGEKAGELSEQVGKFSGETGKVAGKVGQVADRLGQINQQLNQIATEVAKPGANTAQLSSQAKALLGEAKQLLGSANKLALESPRALSPLDKALVISDKAFAIKEGTEPLALNASTTVKGIVGPGGATVQQIGGKVAQLPAGAEVPVGSTVLRGEVFDAALARSLSLGTIIAGGWQTIAGATAPVTASTYIGGAAAVGLGAASQLYTQTVQQQMTGAAFAATARQLRNFSERQQYIQGAILQVLAQTVDDPNKVQDSADIDKDGDREEWIPEFQQWVSTRTGILAGNLFRLFQNWYKEIMEILDSFKNTAKENEEYFLERGFEKPIDPNDPKQIKIIENDGIVVEVARSLYYYAPPVYPLRLDKEFYIPGTNASPDNQLDLIDKTVLELNGFQETMDKAIPEDIKQRILNWETWFSFFYDPGEENAEGEQPAPEPTDDYYHRFNALIGDQSIGEKGLAALSQEIVDKRLQLRDCLPGAPGLVANPPCKTWVDGRLVTTTDENLLDEDEFKSASETLDNLINEMQNFEHNIASFYARIHPELKGIEQVTYSWEDSRCNPGERCHSVKVSAFVPFMLPRIVHKSYGGPVMGQECFELKYYQGVVGVIAERKDTCKDLKSAKFSLGRWSPSGPTGAINRVSFSGYSHDRAGMLGKGTLGKNLARGIREWINKFRQKTSEE